MANKIVVSKRVMGVLLGVIAGGAIGLLVGGGGSSGSLHQGGQSGYSNSNFKGTYTFLAMGSDTQGSQPDQYEVGGVLVADGNGAITGGEQTYSNATGAHADS